MPELTVHASEVMNAPAEKVWEAFTNPAVTKQYMFGCEVESDWQIGSPFLWRGAADGVVYVKGELVAHEPMKHLAYTVFDPNAKIPDIPENYLIVTVDLEPTAGGTRVDVTQGDYSTVADGEARYNDTGDGWQKVLGAIKKIVEG